MLPLEATINTTIDAIFDVRHHHSEEHQHAVRRQVWRRVPRLLHDVDAVRGWLHAYCAPDKRLPELLERETAHAVRQLDLDRIEERACQVHIRK